MIWDPFQKREREATRTSFVERLRDWRDDATWRSFLQRYGRVVRMVAMRAGLRPDEAEDVLQETAATVARKMPEFRFERAKCSLEGWVRHVARRRIQDQFRRRLPAGDPPRTDASDAVAGVGGATGWGRWAEGSLEGEHDEAWEDARRREVLDRALERLQLRVRPGHYQVFCMSVVDARPGPEVARTLGVSLASVYVIRHRLVRLLKEEVRRVEQTPGSLG